VSLNGISAIRLIMAERHHRLSRLIEIILLVRSDEHWKPGALAEHFGISETRLYTDIKDLNAAGVPISYGGTGYVIDESFFLPALNLTPDEVLLLLFPQGLFSRCTTAAGQCLRAKLLSCLPPQTRRFVKEALERTLIEESSTPERDVIFENVHQAVAERRRLLMEYRSIRASDYEPRKVDPLGLVFRKNAWYLVAHCHRAGEFRTFRLSRARRVAVLDEWFSYPKDFSLKEYLAGRCGIYGGDTHEVVIRFSPLAARLVEDAPLLQNGSLLQMSDGSAIFRGQVKGIEELGWWLLKYGEQAEVVRPLELRRQIIETIQRMAALYKLPFVEHMVAEAEADYGFFQEE